MLNKQMMPAIITAILISSVISVSSQLFVVKNPEILALSQRLTKLDRDTQENTKEISNNKIQIIDSRKERFKQFSTILIKLEQIRDEGVKDRLRAVKLESRNEATIRDAAEHMKKQGLHEYRSYTR